MKQVVVKQRNIVPVLNKSPLRFHDEKYKDLEYWLEQPVIERLRAVTFLVSQYVGKSLSMDKTAVTKKKR